MLFRNPFQWAATRVIQKHILHAISDKPRKVSKKTNLYGFGFAQIPASTKMAGFDPEVIAYFNFQCAMHNILVEFLHEGNPMDGICIANMMFEMSRRKWPNSINGEWPTKDITMLSDYHIKSGSLFIMKLLKERATGDCDEKVRIHYDYDTNILTIPSKGIERRVSDYYPENIQRYFLSRKK